MGWVWDRGPEGNPARRLWRLVSPESVTQFRFPDPGVDPRVVVGSLEDRVRAAGVTYAPPPTVFGPGADSQAVRSPLKVWQSKKATCVDMSLLVAAGHLNAGVRPWLVVGERGDGSAHAWLVYDPDTPLVLGQEGPGDGDLAVWEASVHKTTPVFEDPDEIKTWVDTGRVVAVDVTRWCDDYEPLDAGDLFEGCEQVWVCDVAAWWHPAGVEPITGLADTQLVDPLWEIPEDTSRLRVAELTVAKHKVVPFVPGDDYRRLVDQLTTWAHNAQSSDRSGLGLVGLGLITGVGGAGKTRTALKVADTLCGPDGSLDPHALCGVLRRGLTDERAAAIAGRPGTVLLVVDYADSHPSADIDCLAAALRTRPAGWGPVIVLATARTAGDWLHTYIDTLRGVDQDPITMLGTDRPHPADAFVARAHIDTVDHTALAAAAADAFGIDPMRVDRYDTALEVILEIALAAAGEHNPDQPGDTIYGRALAHEHEHWLHLAKPLEGHETLTIAELDLAVTTATLLEPTAAQLRSIGRELGWEDTTARSVDVLYATSNEPDPHQRRIGPLRPDPIADHLIRTTTAEPPPDNDPGWLNRLTHTITTQNQWATFLNTINRAWADQPNQTNQPDHLTNTIHTALTQNRLPLNVALDAATTPGPTRTALTQLAHNNTHTTQLTKELNKRSEVGLERIAETALTHHLNHLRHDPDTDPTDLAHALNNLGVLHIHIGDQRGALERFEEAVTGLRTAASNDPESIPDLAVSLGNLGVARDDVDHRGALEVKTEAVTLLRLAATDNPAHTPHLARGLGKLSVTCGHLGTHEGARAHLEEAVDLLRVAAAPDPAHTPDLADALNSLGGANSDLGCYDAALTLKIEAVDLLRAAATDNPAHTPHLARALNSLGNTCRERADHDAALKFQTEAVELLRAAATDNHGHTPDLARALGSLGETCSGRADHEGARAHLEEAVKLWRAAARDNAALTPDLAISLRNLGMTHSARGNNDAALEVQTEAIELLRIAAADNRAHTPHLATTLSSLGNTCRERADHDAALKFQTEAVELLRVTAADKPAYTPDLAKALNNLARTHNDDRRHHTATDLQTEAVELLRVTAAGNPTHTPDLARALGNLARTHNNDRRHYDTALDLQTEAVELWRTAAADNPAHTASLARALNNLAVTHGNMGHVRIALRLRAERDSLKQTATTDSAGHTPSPRNLIRNWRWRSLLRRVLRAGLSDSLCKRA
ncbi:MAG: tetratricopeptide repeat protein [bacterium]|nr:tetratricopeptide repeat protein [bacterium]